MKTSTYAVLIFHPDTVDIAICTEDDATGRVVDTAQATKPFPINGDRKLRAQAIGKLVALAVEHGATSIEIINDSQQDVEIILDQP